MCPLLLLLIAIPRRHQHAREGICWKKRLEELLQRLLAGEERFEVDAAVDAEENGGGLVVDLTEENAERRGFRLVGEELE